MRGAAWHDFTRCLQNGAAIASAGFAALLILIPFGTAAVPGDSIFDAAVTHDQMKYRLITDGFVLPVWAAVILLGFALGFAMYRFVLDPSSSQAYFSFSLTRGALHRSRFAAGALLLFLAALLPMATSLLLNLLAFGGYTGLIPAWAYITGGLFLAGLAAFCCAAIGCLLSGAAIEAISYACALLAAPYAVSYAAGEFLRRLLWGNPYGAFPYLGAGPVMPSAADRMAAFDPLRFFYRRLMKHRMYYRLQTSLAPDPVEPLLLLAWAAAVAALGFAALLLMKRRRAEQAGFLWKNKAALHVCAFIPTLYACAFVFGLAAGASVAFGAALLALLFLLCALPAGKAAQSSAGMAWIESALKAAVLFALMAGASVGYGPYRSLPAASGVSAVSVSYAGSPNALGVPAYGSSRASDYYFSAPYRYESGEDIVKACYVHGLFNAGGRRALANGKGIKDTVVPYDVQFTYTLANGKEKTWYYDRASFSQLRSLLALEGTSAAREARDAAFGAGRPPDGMIWAREAYLGGDIYLSDPTYRETYALNLPQRDRDTFLAAILADEAALNLEERYFPDKAAVGILLFTRAGAEDLASWSYHLNNAFVFISEKHTGTMAFLKERGLWLEQYPDEPALAEGIERLILQPWDPYIGINAPSFPQSLFFMSYISGRPDQFRNVKDFGRPDEVRDPAEIAGIADSLRNYYYLTEEGFLAAVKYKGSAAWVYLFLPGAHSVMGHDMQ